MSLDSILLIGAVVLLLAIGSSRIGSRLGLPALLLFLGIGMAFALFGFGLRDPDLAHALGFAALVIILYEGGITTRWKDIRGSLLLAALLATVGVLVSIALIGVFGYVALGMPLALALLFGAITAPTDSAAVFSVLRKVPLPARVRATLEAESGLNDAPVVLLVSAATSLAAGTSHVSGLPVTLLLIAGEFLGGILLGVVFGWAGARALRGVALPSSGLYPLAALGWSVFAYGIGTAIHLSGFAAVYTCAVVLGNAKLPHRMATRSFAEGLGWVAQIGLFVMLGLLANPFAITLGEIGIGLAAGLFLTFVARPLSVMACAVWFKIPWREQVFLSWAGLRGAVPIILATVPMAAGLAGSLHLFNIVIVFVIAFTLLQAPTLPWAARVLGLADAGPTDVEVEVAPLDRIQADMMQVTVPVGSHLVGLEILELRLPRTAVVSLIIRDDEYIVPSPSTRIIAGDALLIVTSKQVRPATEERLRVLGYGGRLARWSQKVDIPEDPPPRLPRLIRRADA
ncbi:potassium/proton antiporter [Propionicicella superfundia]|uniref:potassium/proton antiporter n=1 Tax=Propionicicella superfundia TaxID=348582 RepID=UPI000423C3F7|nr:potassium/proton antiporter [Propionicicella superfundia]